MAGSPANNKRNFAPPPAYPKLHKQTPLGFWPGLSIGTRNLYREILFYNPMDRQNKRCVSSVIDEIRDFISVGDPVELIFAHVHDNLDITPSIDLPMRVSKIVSTARESTHNCVEELDDDGNAIGTYPILSLKTFRKQNAMVCRHYVLLGSMIFKQLQHENLFPEGQFYQFREYTTLGRHAVLVFQTGGDVYLLDLMQGHCLKIENPEDGMEFYGYSFMTEFNKSYPIVEEPDTATALQPLARRNAIHVPGTSDRDEKTDHRPELVRTGAFIGKLP